MAKKPQSNSNGKHGRKALKVFLPIRCLKIENLRSIKKLELRFDEPVPTGREWTILLGENGSGKSTILRAIALVTCGSDALPGLLADPSSWVRNGTKQARIEAELLTAEGEPRTVTLEIGAGQSVSGVVKRNDANLKALDAALGHATRSYFVAGYGASRRLPGKDSPSFMQQEAFHQPRAQSVASLFSRDATLRSLESWAMDLQYRRQKIAGSLLAPTLKSLLPGLAFLRIDRQKRRLMFNTPDGPVPLDQLSDGYQNMAAWIGDLLFRLTEAFQDYKKPLEARGVLLLDESDLHLHPVWQRQLLAFLGEKLPNFQIIATTHSPFTAQQAPPGALHIVERAPSGTSRSMRVRSADVRVRQYAGDPRLLRVDQLVGPLLGLATVESAAVEKKRSQLTAMKSKKRLSARDRTEMGRLKATIAGLPPPPSLIPVPKKSLDLLQRVEQQLARIESKAT